MLLFHGSSETAPFEVAEHNNPCGVEFGGIFASCSRLAAESHGGGKVFCLEVPDEKILSTFHLVYEMDYATTRKALFCAFGRDLSEEEEDLAWTAVVEDRALKLSDDELCDLVGLSDASEAGWECQRLRGQVAKALGFQAVEMSDEHGTSYLVLPGVTLRECGEDER